MFEIVEKFEIVLSQNKFIVTVNRSNENVMSRHKNAMIILLFLALTPTYIDIICIKGLI